MVNASVFNFRSMSNDALFMKNEFKAQFGYCYGLDALRFVAVSIVIIRHYQIIPIMPGGFGVSIFFFISGFLISRLLIAEKNKYGKINLRNFYIRRLIRLVPPLLLMGVFCVPALYFLFPSEFSYWQVIASFLYMGNFEKIATFFTDIPAGIQALEPLWSLAVEEHFYLVFPVFLTFFSSHRYRVLFLALALIIPLLLRMGVAVVFPVYRDEINYFSTFTRIDAMAWGILLTFVLNSFSSIGRFVERHGLLIFYGGALLMLLSLVRWTAYYDEVIKYTPQSIAIGMFFAGFIFSSKTAWVRYIAELNIFRFLGKTSYEIYLWHFPVLTFVSYFLKDFLLSVTLSLLLTLLISTVAYQIVTRKLKPLRAAFGGHPL